MCITDGGIERVGMETSLHRELKRMYAQDDGRTEVSLGKYRIDVVAGDELIEIQHGPLSAIRDKVRRLLAEHRVRVVKPIIARKLLVKRPAKGKPAEARRRSPKRGQLLDVFDELVHFTRVFPHRRLTLEVVLVEIEEWRYPGHGRRRYHRDADHEVEDQKLVRIAGVHRLKTSADLRKLVPCQLPKPFHTGHLAEALNIDRYVAGRIAYCFRQVGTTRQVGKQGNSLLYEFVSGRRRAQAA